jgi:hypothetical protein
MSEFIFLKDPEDTEMQGIPSICCAVGESKDPDSLWEFGVYPRETKRETVDLIILWLKAHRELIDAFIAGGPEPKAYIDGYRIFFTRYSDL